MGGNHLDAVVDAGAGSGDVRSKTAFAHRALFMMLGIGSWITINGIFLEMPLLVNELPEGWSLPAYLAVVTQLGNIGPLAYGLIDRYLRKTHTEARRSAANAAAAGVPPAAATAVLLSLSTFAMFLLACGVWRSVTVVCGRPHAVALLGLAFVASLADCTSSLVFWPFVAGCRPRFILALAVGEASSAVVAAGLALLQGQGADGGLLFGPNVYFGILVALLVLSGVSFCAIRRLLRGQRGSQMAILRRPSVLLLGEHARPRSIPHTPPTGRAMVVGADAVKPPLATAATPLLLSEPPHLRASTSTAAVRNPMSPTSSSSDSSKMAAAVPSSQADSSTASYGTCGSPPHAGSHASVRSTTLQVATADLSPPLTPTPVEPISPNSLATAGGPYDDSLDAPPISTMGLVRSTSASTSAHDVLLLAQASQATPTRARAHAAQVSWAGQRIQRAKNAGRPGCVARIEQGQGQGQGQRQLVADAGTGASVGTVAAMSPDAVRSSPPSLTKAAKTAPALCVCFGPVQVLLTMQAAVCFAQNGALPAVLAFACMPFQGGARTYRWAQALAAAAQPLGAALVHCGRPSMRALLSVAALCALCVGFIILVAVRQQRRLHAASLGAGGVDAMHDQLPHTEIGWLGNGYVPSLVVAASAVSSVLLSYSKAGGLLQLTSLGRAHSRALRRSNAQDADHALAHVVHDAAPAHEERRLLQWAGAAMQIGSFGGALLFFFIITGI